MNLLKIFKKSEKGSITLMVLTAMIFVLVVITASYFAISNKSGNQNKKILKIAQQYRASTEDMDQEYRNTLNNASLTMEQAQNTGMFEKITNTELVDTYGNQIVVPAGFRITEDATDVTQGLVIEDKEGNQFVWVPVGEIYTDVAKTDAGKKTIVIGRYNFAEDGTYTDWSDGNYTEDTIENHNSNYGNAIAKDIEEFRTSANNNHGYYIGRYEAGVVGYDSQATITENTNSEANWTGYQNASGESLKLVCKANQQVWNYITQNKASEVSRNMYASSKFTSDLLNSYAWDTAIAFIQTFAKESNSATYSYQNGESSKLAETGTGILKSTGKVDKQCNLFDMAGNCLELTTETYSTSTGMCVLRGGVFAHNSIHTESRGYNNITSAFDSYSFRPILYLK